MSGEGWGGYQRRGLLGTFRTDQWHEDGRAVLTDSRGKAALAAARDLTLHSGHSHLLISVFYSRSVARLQLLEEHHPSRPTPDSSPRLRFRPSLSRAFMSSAEPAVSAVSPGEPVNFLTADVQPCALMSSEPPA